MLTRLLRLPRLIVFQAQPVDNAGHAGTAALLLDAQLLQQLILFMGQRDRDARIFSVFSLHFLVYIRYNV